MTDQARQPEVAPVDGTRQLAAEAARRFVAAACQSVADHGEFRVALSGGSTPRALFAALASDPFRDQAPWDRMQIFFSDERFVLPDSDQSNYHSAQEGLLSRVPVPERRIHRVATVDIRPEQSAELYEEGIRRVFHVDRVTVPAFDLILLGMGPDGHTASLFPDTPALRVHDRLVVPNFVPRLDAWRITFTYPLLNAAHLVTFLVQGEDKHKALTAVLSGRSDLPAAGVRPTHGHVVWIVDRSALGPSGA